MHSWITLQVSLTCFCVPYSSSICIGMNEHRIDTIECRKKTSNAGTHLFAQCLVSRQCESLTLHSCLQNTDETIKTLVMPRHERSVTICKCCTCCEKWTCQEWCMLTYPLLVVLSGNVNLHEICIWTPLQFCETSCSPTWEVPWMPTKPSIRRILKSSSLRFSFIVLVAIPMTSDEARLTACNVSRAMTHMPQLEMAPKE